MPLMAQREARFARGSFADSVIESAQPQPAELPAPRGAKEVAIRRPGVTLRGRQRRTAQYHLIDHEFAVVFAERARLGDVVRIRQIGAARPLPYRAKGVFEGAGLCRDFPFRFARQVLAGP